MKSASIATLVAFTAFKTVSAQATTSLIIPGFDPQPLSADVIGVDTAAEQTTWVVQAGQDPSWQDGFLPGTATLVQGSGYASILYIGSDTSVTFTMAEGCTYQGSQAICSGTQDGQAVTETDIADDTPIAVVVGTTVVPGPTTPAPGGMVTSVASSGTISGPGSGAPTPTQSSGALSVSITWSSIVALCSALAVGLSMMA